VTARRWDVVVVGARVAGAATAMLLARAGLEVLCLDRAPAGTDTVSTHALMRGGVLQLTRWGLLPAVIDAGTPPVHRSVFHHGSRTQTVTIRPRAGVDALYAPRRTVIDPLLVQAARDAGATVEHGAAVRGLLRSRAGTVEGVTVRTRDGRTRDERTHLVVGADGQGSLVAREAGAGVTWRGSAASDWVYTYAPVETDGYEWFYGDARSGGLIPTNGGLACVFTGGPPDTMTEAWERHGQRAWPWLPQPDELARRTEGLIGAHPLRHVAGTPALLRQAVGDGWALVGDAGSWKDPLSTHGMTDAMRDAELLSRAVVAWSAGDTDALAGYERLRDQLTVPLLEATEPLASHAWDASTTPDLVRTLASAMADEVDLLLALDAVPGAPEPVTRGTEPGAVAAAV
jgi:2-polyprenyl-6-methoxyphenol hydroxylase-like FAD-dependent oxidoreductase